MKYENFNRTNLKNFRGELEELLNKYGVNSNLEFSIGNIKFSDSEVEVKVTAKVKGAKTFTNILLETRVASLGIKMINAKGDQLVDYNPRSWKMPFVYKTKEGKLFKCDENVAKKLFSV